MCILKNKGTRKSFVNANQLMKELSISRLRELVLALEESTSIAFSNKEVKPYPRANDVDHHLMNKDARRKIALDYQDSPEAVELCNVYRVSKQRRIFTVIEKKILERINITRESNGLLPIDELEDNANKADGYLPFNNMTVEEATTMILKDIDTASNFIDYGDNFILPSADGSLKILTRKDYYNAVSESNRRSALAGELCPRHGEELAVNLSA